MLETDSNDLTLLGFLLVGLKLGGVIDWSWWYITLPFWGIDALLLGMAAIVFIFGLNKK